MRTSSELNELAEALSKSQGEYVGLIKDIPVKMELKNGRKIEYDFLDLGSIVEAVKGIISKHGLSVTQPIGVADGRPALYTMLMHKSGQFIESYVHLDFEKTDYNGQAAKMSEQEKGSVVTFQSRYNYVGILRIPLKNEDTDAVDLNPNAKNLPDVQETKKLLEDPSQFVIQFGTKFKGKKLADVSNEDRDKNIEYGLKKKKEGVKPLGIETFLLNAEAYLVKNGYYPPTNELNKEELK